MTVFKIIFFLFLSFFLFTSFSSKAFADSPTVTILNPIRGNQLGHDNENLLPGLKAQWQATQHAGFNATWLWQYSALENQPLVDFAKKQMHHQEFGIFLEIDRNFAQKAGVQYRGNGPWYFSDGLLLVSYDVAERQKLIDTVFQKFKKTFGYYPKTVGAWWIGAQSLDYMQQKYGITAAMKAADQYGIDAYTIWGSPWGIPYVASTTNESIPAHSSADSSKVVVMQWAARDPLLAYGNSLQYGLYSTQDFESKGLDISYFTYLLNTYLKKPDDQLLVGLENSKPALFSPTSRYTKTLQLMAHLQSQGKIQVRLAKEYAEEFLHKNLLVAPTHILLTTQFSGTNQAFWYISPNYQIALQKIGNQLLLVDLRNYANKTPENFYTLPNSQGNLLVNTPAIIDSATFPQQKKLLATVTSPLTMHQANGQTILESGSKILGTFTDSTFYINIKPPIAFSAAKQTCFLSPFIFLLVLFLLYALVFYVFTKNTKQTALIFLFAIPLLLAYPFLQNYPLIFDKKALRVLQFFLIPNLSLQVKIFLLQITPFLFLPIAHMLSIQLHKQRIVYVVVFILIILFFHFPYFPLDHSTYKIIGITFVFFFVLSSFAACLVVWKIKTLKALLLSFTSISMLMLILGITLVFSRSQEILNPFEIVSLQVLAQQKQSVIFIQPNNPPMYKAVRPLIFDNSKFIERLTQTKWQFIMRDAKNNLVIPQVTNTLVFVPRYLGATIYPEEIAKYHLHPIFDNMEIGIFAPSPF